MGSEMNNGIGPEWFPDWLRKALTRFGSHFFDEASWDKHDEGYAAGYPSRAICDRKFLQAMLRDASKTKTTLKIMGCTTLAWFFWFCVRVGGRFSYNKPFAWWERAAIAVIIWAVIWWLFIA